MNDTLELIERLARDAGRRDSSDTVPATFKTLLLMSTVGAFCVGLALICTFFAGHFNATKVIMSFPFQFKTATMTILAVAAFLTLQREGVPGSDMRIAWSILLAPAALGLLVMLDGGSYPPFGTHRESVPICFLAICGASAPALFILLRTMRAAVVTRPGVAGALAGLLAGALGAGAYAIACRNDGPLFVFIWYDLAVATVCVLGALVGQRYLRW